VQGFNRRWRLRNGKGNEGRQGQGVAGGYPGPRPSRKPRPLTRFHGSSNRLTESKGQRERERERERESTARKEGEGGTRRRRGSPAAAERGRRDGEGQTDARGSRGDGGRRRRGVWWWCAQRRGERSSTRGGGAAQAVYNKKAAAACGGGVARQTAGLEPQPATHHARRGEKTMPFVALCLSSALPAIDFSSGCKLHVILRVFFFLQPGLHTTPREFTLRRKKRDN
jgi:hypothetical protein